MTALDERPVAPLPTRIPRGMFRTIAFSSIRKTAERELDGEITAAQAAERIARHADHQLTNEARGQAYEQLKDRLSFAAHLLGDDFDASQYETDRETLAGDAELDIEVHVGTLVGPRR